LGTRVGRHVIQDRINLRRHRNACKHYRENWATPDALYQAICLRDMPPLTAEEQERCFRSKDGCWREEKKKTRQRVGVNAT
jgi:hypothetical protein